jgi:hypothetical protein
VPATRIGTATRHGRPRIGPTSTSAPSAKNTVTIAISVSGTANRTLCDSASTSRLVRVSRSPLPARSTVDTGMAPPIYVLPGGPGPGQRSTGLKSHEWAERVTRYAGGSGSGAGLLRHFETTTTR